MEKRHVLTMQKLERRGSRRRHSSLTATVMLRSGDGQAVGQSRPCPPFENLTSHSLPLSDSVSSIDGYFQCVCLTCAHRREAARARKTGFAIPNNGRRL